MISFVRFLTANIDRNIMLVVFIVVAVAIVAITISFLITNFFQNNLHKNILDKSNTVRIYVIDVKNDNVEYFNSASLRQRKSVSITTFYTHFDSKYRLKLISWIGDLLEDANDVKNFMEIGSYVKRFKRIIPSILQVQKIDHENQLIYMESHLVGVEDSKKNKTYTFVTRDRYLKAIKQREGVGCSFCINFYNKFTKSDDISELAYVELKNIVSTFASDKVCITEYQDTKFFISNFDCDNKIEALNFVNLVIGKIKSYLLIESLAEEIDVSIGATENIYFKHDTTAIIKTLYKLANFAKDDKQQIIFFDESKKSLSEESLFKTQVEEIVETGKLQYFYQPIYSFKYNRAIAYFSYVNPTGTVFADIDELKKFAVRTDDDQELFSTIAKNTISQFCQEKGSLNVNLFMGVAISELPYVVPILSHVNDAKETNIVLVIHENEVENVLNNQEDGVTNFINIIKMIKSNGFSVALIINNDILNLSPNIYSLFDYYIIKASDYVVNRKDSKIPAFKALVENLIRYNKSLIALDIPTWDAVDLVYKFGIENISGDPIGQKKENIVPIDRKTFLKIKKLRA